MARLWLPRVLLPEFTWPGQAKRDIIDDRTPPVPSIAGPIVRRFWGLVHKALYHFSGLYCSWFDIPFDRAVVQLPFGLMLKWTDRVRLEEVVAMKMARDAGMPVPKVLSCGEHPDDYRRISILMTRLPGFELFNSRDPLVMDDEGPWIDELGRCLCAMRKWRNPFGETQVCSGTGTNISSHRVPNHRMGPFSDEKGLNQYLLSAASSHAFFSQEKFDETLVRAQKMFDLSHRIVFTHGDLKAHNILTDFEGHLTGFIDWECAGWYPDYWELVTAMRFARNTWWYEVALELGGEQYLPQLECDQALNRLTADSYIGW